MVKSRGNPAWVKGGQSPNPGGRGQRKLIDELLIEALEAEDLSAARAIAGRLIGSAKQGNLRAIKLILERTQGRPVQKVEMSGPDGNSLFEMTDEQLDAQIAALME